MGIFNKKNATPNNNYDEQYLFSKVLYPVLINSRGVNAEVHNHCARLSNNANDFMKCTKEDILFLKRMVETERNTAHYQDCLMKYNEVLNTFVSGLKIE